MKVWVINYHLDYENIMLDRMQLFEKFETAMAFLASKGDQNVYPSYESLPEKFVYVVDTEDGYWTMVNMDVQKGDADADGND